MAYILTATEDANAEAGRRIMAQVARGRITQAEAAGMLGVARSTVMRRCKALTIDPEAARAKYARRLVARAQALCGRAARD